MEYGTVVGIDKPISRLVHGAMVLTGEDDAKEFALLDAVVEMGGNTFDTAHVYGGGSSERTIGRWMASRGNRDQVVILGKGAHHSQDRKRVTPFDITADIHDSLERFKVEDIDLYLLHRDDPSLPVGPIVEVLNEHKEAGHIHAFGGSNWSHQRIEEANAYAEANGLTPFAASSPNFSLADQVQAPWPDCVSISGPSGEDARAHYLEQKTPLFTWSSLAGGFFTGRFHRHNLDEFTEYADKVCVASYCSEENFQRLDRVQELAATKGVNVIQIAVAFVLAQPLNIYALVGCYTPKEFQDNVEAMELKLTSEELEWLDLKR